MSEENAEIVSSWYEGVNRYHAAKARGDEGELQTIWDAVVSFVAPGFEYCEDPRWPGAQTYRGIDKCRAVWEEYYEQVGEQVFVPEDFMAARDKVLALITWRGKGTTSGAETEMRQGHVFTLRNRRLTRWEIFFDRDEALEAAGLSE